ncbi:hypothetical protein [Pyxidicoccus fallax]|nr:hypothetical protein [Pyxidicoccus fallax]
MSVVRVAACAFLLGACGPAMEGEELKVAEPMVEKDAPSGVPDPDALEVSEPGMVRAQGIVGELGSLLGSPVTPPYAGISTASNQWYVNCNNGYSRDIAYTWRVPATGSYTFSTTGSNFDTVLQIRRLSNTSEVLGCNDDTPSTLQSRITLNSLFSGAQLLIIIEGYDYGEYTDYGNIARLNITRNN